MFEVFGLKGIDSLDALKEKLMEDGVVHSKYKKKISGMTERQLKEFVFFREYHEKEFVAVATIFTSVVQKDIRKLIKYILGIPQGSQNILRVMIDTLANIDIYKESDMLHRHLFVFRTKYEAKFKSLLFDYGVDTKMDKLDLLGLFIKLLK